MHIAQIILLILIIVVAGVGIWLWFTEFATQSASTSPTLGGGLKIEAVSATDSKLYIYVRNIGATPLTLDKIYIWDSKRRLVAVYNATTLNLLVWGGDVWDVSSSARLVERGLILYDNFDGNSLDTSLWEEREYNANNTQLSVGNSYLQITVSSKEEYTWATYGVFTKSPISLPDSYVFEVELIKKGYANWFYAVCLYIMSTNTSNNPYHNTPWFATKLYPREENDNIYTVAQLVYREENTTYWDSSLYWQGSVEPHAHMIVVVENGYPTKVLLWKDSRGKEPIVNNPPRQIYGRELRAVWGNVYLALTVDNPTTYLDEGWFGYIKIYKRTDFTLTGLRPNAEYRLIGLKGKCTIKTGATILTIDPINPPPGCEWLREEYYEHGYPMNITLDSEVFGRIEPQELRTLILRVNLPAGIYTLEITTKEGISATLTTLIKKRG